LVEVINFLDFPPFAFPLDFVEGVDVLSEALETARDMSLAVVFFEVPLIAMPKYLPFGVGCGKYINEQQKEGASNIGQHSNNHGKLGNLVEQRDFVEHTVNKRQSFRFVQEIPNLVEQDNWRHLDGKFPGQVDVRLKQHPIQGQQGKNRCQKQH
jgi:hypothetical protein